MQPKQCCNVDGKRAGIISIMYQHGDSCGLWDVILGAWVEILWGVSNVRARILHKIF